jgi:hypothetical protein
MTTIDRDRTQNVPAGAPSGTYTYEGRVGNYPDEIWESDSFTFEKLETGDGEMSYDWLNTGKDFINKTAADELLPSSFYLFPCHPNPFNPTTTISFALPELAKINLSVYNVTGSLVAELINGYRGAGLHEVAFDASHLPSGVYLAHFSVGEFEQVKKLVLMK